MGSTMRSNIKGTTSWEPRIDSQSISGALPAREKFWEGVASSQSLGFDCLEWGRSETSPDQRIFTKPYHWVTSWTWWLGNRVSWRKSTTWSNSIQVHRRVRWEYRKPSLQVLVKLALSWAQTPFTQPSLILMEMIAWYMPMTVTHSGQSVFTVGLTTNTSNSLIHANTFATLGSFPQSSSINALTPWWRHRLILIPSDPMEGPTCLANLIPSFLAHFCWLLWNQVTSLIFPPNRPPHPKLLHETTCCLMVHV